MKERPILMQGAMVRALLDGSKTQTRRIVKSQPPEDESVLTGLYHPTRTDRHGEEYPGDEVFGAFTLEGGWALPCPYGQPGDQLWVRETHEAYYIGMEQYPGKPVQYSSRLRYRADDFCREVEIDCVTYAKLDESESKGWAPSIFMPRWACRILLEIVSVRVERLNDCSETDAISEGVLGLRSQAWDREHFPVWRYQFEEAVSNGCKPPIGPSPAQAYEALWDSINGAGSWTANPWVWCVEFRRIEP